MLLARWGASLGLGALGGWGAVAIGAPLPWLIGALFAVGAAAVANVRPFGAPIAFPSRLRLVFIPVIGVLIGGAATPELIGAAPGWWPGVLAVLLFVGAAHAVNYALFRRAGLSKPTAYFAGMPGGLIESLELGERAGADMATLSALQFARIAITVTALPLIFLVIEGRAVGSAAGARLEGVGPLGLADAAILTAAGAVGFFAARAIRMPAGQILGPILASGAVHALGWTHAAPPDWLVSVAQLVIGASLGQRFAGIGRGALVRCVALSAASVAIMLAIGAAIGSGMAALGVAPTSVMLVALAPGGVVEMGLIALSLGADPIFVTFHHLVRILATVLGGVAVWRRLADG